jgi:hypothetical protein
MVELRLAVAADAEELAMLQREYMRELFDKPWGGTVEKLARDLEEQRLSAALAIHSAEIVGFVAWTDGYDMHHCVRGGEMIDLYVRRRFRGVGRSAQLVAFACGEIAKSGGVYIKGTAVASAAPLYNRVAGGWDCREMILGGRAFRTVAANAGATPREIVRGLPKPEWNQEP